MTTEEAFRVAADWLSRPLPYVTCEAEVTIHGITFTIAGRIRNNTIKAHFEASMLMSEEKSRERVQAWTNDVILAFRACPALETIPRYVRT